MRMPVAIANAEHEQRARQQYRADTSLRDNAKLAAEGC